MIQINISMVPYVKSKKSNIEAKDTGAMLYQTTCLLVVGSPSFWNAPNSTWASKSGSIPAKTSLNKVRAPCQMCPKKKSKANVACPKVNQPLGLLRKTPSDFKVARSNSQLSGVNWDLRVVTESYKWVDKAVVFRPELGNWQSSVIDGLLVVFAPTPFYSFHAQFDQTPVSWFKARILS